VGYGVDAARVGTSADETFRQRGSDHARPDRTPGRTGSCVTFVGKQRSDREADVEQFVVDMAHKYPWSRVVVGDTSTIENMRGKERRDVWTPLPGRPQGSTRRMGRGPDIRDERVVSEVTDIIAFDESSRVKRYCDLAKRMTGRKVWFV
jgi:hypothetical protein